MLFVIVFFSRFIYKSVLRHRLKKHIVFLLFIGGMNKSKNFTINHTYNHPKVNSASLSKTKPATSPTLSNRSERFEKFQNKPTPPQQPPLHLTPKHPPRCTMRLSCGGQSRHKSAGRAIKPGQSAFVGLFVVYVLLLLAPLCVVGCVGLNRATDPARGLFHVSIHKID